MPCSLPATLLEATALLREAAALDPANAEPRRRLARLLLAGGARRQGIEELRAVTRLDPADTESWRSLAATQFAEGLYADATETYRAFSEAQPAAFAQDGVQLSYADALRLAGRAAEARPIYRRLSSSSDAEVARASRQHIEQLTPPAAAIAAERNRTQPDDADTARAEANRPPESVLLPPPTPKPSVAREEVATPRARRPSRRENITSGGQAYGRRIVRRQSRSFARRRRGATRTPATTSV
jgi:tetratricopeptide (TPR) repeat protein